MTKSQREEMIKKIVDAAGSIHYLSELSLMPDAEIRRIGRTFGVWLVIRPSPAIANQSNVSASDGLQ